MWIEKSKIIHGREMWHVYQDGGMVAILEIGQIYESNSGVLYKLDEVCHELSRVRVTRLQQVHNQSYYWFIQSLICNSMNLHEEQTTVREFPYHT